MTSCADRLLRTGDECVLVPVGAEWWRTQELQLGPNQLQLLIPEQLRPEQLIPEQSLT